MALDLSRTISITTEGKHREIHPAQVLLEHSTLRGIEAGAAFGMITSPLVAILRKMNLVTAYRRGVPLYACLGAAGTTAYILYQYGMGHLDRAGVDRRARLILENRSQMYVDSVSLKAGAAGAVYGALFCNRAIMSVASSSLTGIVLGVGYCYLDEKGYVDQGMKVVQETISMRK